MLEISKNLFDMWNSNNILYCHWKSNEHLMEGLEGITDLDVLVSKKDKIKCEKIMKQLGILKCKSQYGSRYANVDDWIALDEKTGMLIHIHLHYDMITGHKGMKEYNLPWDELALKTRIKDKKTGVYITEPNLEIVILYTRISLKATIRQIIKAKQGKLSLGKDDIDELNYLKQRIDWKKVEEILKGYYIEDKKIINIMKKDVLGSEEFLELNKIISKSMNKYRRMNGLNAWVTKYYYAFILRIINFIRYRLKRILIVRKVFESKGGLLITFIGQDGSGKSTVTSDLEKWFTWKLDARKFYLGSGEHYNSWQKSLRAMLPNKKLLPVALISAWLTLSDLQSLSKKTYKTIYRAKKYANKGGIAIFDRYPQVNFYGINDGPKIRTNYISKIKNPILKTYALKCANKEEKYLKKATEIYPDLVFKLNLPPQVSIQRKPEENFELVKQKHEIIKQLVFNNAEVYTIDATQKYDDEIREIKRLLWKQIQKQK